MLYRVAAFSAAVGALIITANPSNADGYAPPRYAPALAPAAWGGFYVGVHGGYATGEHEGVGTYTDNTGSFQVLDPIESSLDTDGGFGGLQAGYNLQYGTIVYGIEGDVSWGDISGDGTFTSDDGNNGTTDYTWHIKTDYDWLEPVLAAMAKAAPDLARGAKDKFQTQVAHQTQGQEPQKKNAKPSPAEAEEKTPAPKPMRSE